MRLMQTPQVRITLIYVIVASIWIYFSDKALGLLVDDPQNMVRAQILKGWLFVGITGGMLYALIGQYFQSIRRTHRELLNSYEQTIRGWVVVMDQRHKETRHHTERVSRMTVSFARRAGVAERDLPTIERGAILHDLGKIGIPDSILIKPGKLSEEEWQVMRTHPVVAREILEQIDFLRPSIDIPWCHHEKWDGSGYPQGLSGDAIPLGARLFAIVDVWDALIHDRVYKNAWPEHQVLAHIRQQAGKHFDPHLAELFIRDYRLILEDAGVDDLNGITSGDEDSCTPGAVDARD